MVLEDALSPAMTSASPKLHSNILNRYEVTSDVMPACVASSFPHDDIYKRRLGREEQLSESSSPEVASYESYAASYRTFDPTSPSTDSGTKSDESRKSMTSPVKRSPESNRNNNSCKPGVNDRSQRPEECPRSTSKHDVRNSHPLKKRMLFGRSTSTSPVDQQRKSPALSNNAPGQQFPDSSVILRQMYAAFGGDLGRGFKYNPDQTRITDPAAGREAPSEGPLPPGTRSLQGHATPPPPSSPGCPARRPDAPVTRDSRGAVPHATVGRRQSREQPRKRCTESPSPVVSPSKVSKPSSLQSDPTAFHAYKRKSSELVSSKDPDPKRIFDDSQTTNRKRKCEQDSPRRNAETRHEKSDTNRRRSLSGVKRSRHTSSESCDSQTRASYPRNVAGLPQFPYAPPFAFNPTAFGFPGMGVQFGIPPVPQPNPVAANPFLLGANSYLTNPLLMREIIAAQTNAANMTSLFQSPSPFGGFPGLMPGITLEQMQALQHLQASALLGQGTPPQFSIPVAGKPLEPENRRLSNESRRHESRDRVRSPVTPPHLPRDLGAGKTPRTPAVTDNATKPSPFYNKTPVPSVHKTGSLPKPRSEKKRNEKKGEKAKSKTTESRKKLAEPVVTLQRKTNAEVTQPTNDPIEDLEEPLSEETSPLDETSGCPKSAGYKNLTRERRLVANARERTRVHTISSAFDELRAQVPSYSCNQKLSKLAILRIACSYIRTLSVLAGRDETTPFSQGVDQCTKVLQAESRARSRRKSNKAQIEWEMVNYERQKSVEDGSKPDYETTNYVSDDVTRENDVDVETVDERIDVLEDVTNRTNTTADEGCDKFTKSPAGNLQCPEDKATDHVTAVRSENQI